MSGIERLVTILPVVVWSCAVNPATGERQLSLVGEGREIEMGREADQSLVVSMGMYDDASLASYVEGLGQKLAAVSERPQLPWTFRLMDDPIVNAFALPGGFIYITRGILGYIDSEAQLVEILGHEIGHVTARHSVEQISRAQLAQVGLVAGVVFAPGVADFAGLAQAGLGLLFLKFGRDDERQSDDLGLRYALRAGYDPRPAPGVFRMLDAVSRAHGGGSTPEWLSTHPNPENRAERLEEQIAALTENLDGRIVGRDRFLEQIDGLVYGANPRQGFFQDNLFLHPELRFQIRFPSEWQTVNQPQAVAGISEAKNAIMQLSLASGASSLGAAFQAFASRDGVSAGGQRSTTVNGHNAVNAAFTATTEQGQLRGEVLFVSFDRNVYQIIGYGTPEGWNRSASTLRTAMSTFDEVTDPAVLNVQPQRIDIVTLTESLTLAQFSARNPSVVSLDELALLNQRDPDAPIPAGTRVKRVIQ